MSIYPQPSPLTPVFNVSSWGTGVSNSSSDIQLTNTNSYDQTLVTNPMPLIDWNFAYSYPNPLKNRFVAIGGGNLYLTNGVVVLDTSTGLNGGCGATPAKSIRCTSMVPLDIIFTSSYSTDNFLGLQVMGHNSLTEAAWFGTYFQGDLCTGLQYGGSMAYLLMNVNNASTTSNTAVLTIPNPVGNFRVCFSDSNVADLF